MTNARQCFEKGLELSKHQVEERARYEECERRLKEVKEVEEQMNCIQHNFASTNQVLKTIRALLALKDHCPNWRDLYVQLIHCYLLVGNTSSARIALNRVTPNIEPFLSSSSSAYPFTIAAWDAERLDLFSNDVSGVDVEVVSLWVQLLVMEGNVQGCLRLIHRCEDEPRFRDVRKYCLLLQPYLFLERWQVGAVERPDPRVTVRTPSRAIRTNDGWTVCFILISAWKRFVCSLPSTVV